MIKSLQSTEGIHLDVNGDTDESTANLPLEKLDDGDDCCGNNGDICLDGVDEDEDEDGDNLEA